MSMFTPVEALRNRQQRLTFLPNQFINGLPYIRVSVWPLPTERKESRQEQIRKEVAQL
jgi:hypothetical protein